MIKDNPLNHPIALSLAIISNIVLSPIMATIQSVKFVRACKRGEIGQNGEENQTHIPTKRLGRLILTETPKVKPKRDGIGEILGFMIEAHGMTKSGFSEKVGCDPSQLQYWLNGSDIRFPIERAEKMSQVFGYETTGDFLKALVDGAKLRKKVVNKMILTNP